jgi:hypothetical protein
VQDVGLQVLDGVGPVTVADPVAGELVVVPVVSAVVLPLGAGEVKSSPVLAPQPNAAKAKTRARGERARTMA